MIAAVVSPGVKVAIGSDGQSEVVSCIDSAEADAAIGGRGQRCRGSARRRAVAGTQAPGVGPLGPVGGQGDVVGDGLGEIICYGCAAGEPAVKEVAPMDGVSGPCRQGLIVDALACAGA